VPIMNCRLLSYCLQPKFSLRYQLWASFGSISFIAILFVLLLSISILITAGNIVEADVKISMAAQSRTTLQRYTELLADTCSKKFERLTGAVSLIAEVTADRIVGNNWEFDSEVPFTDMITNTSLFPIAPVSLPPDWNLTKNVNEENYLEHLQERRKTWYNHEEISTAHATFRFQGQCDPAAEEGDKTYFENCTELNNNVATCGIVNPVKSRLHEKVGFLQYILKPIFETDDSIKQIGVHFFNEGAGAAVVYPAQTIDGTVSYKSIGCDWMLNNTNPRTGKPFATREQVKRCHNAGEDVPGRAYNAFEREWCRDQVLHGIGPHVSTPYFDVFQKDLKTITFGQAVFDRVAGNLIACTLIDVSTAYFNEWLKEVVLLEDANAAIFNWENEDLIASLGVNRRNAHVEANHLSITGEEYQNMKSHANERYGTATREPWEKNQYLITASSMILVPPTESDENYKVVAILMMIVPKNFLTKADRHKVVYNQTVNSAIYMALLKGSTGFLLALFFIWLVARWLTKPLEWIESASKRILQSDELADDGKDPSVRWRPKTEITNLVLGFRKMIQNFSGDRPAQIAYRTMHEIPNAFSCSQELKQLSGESEIVGLGRGAVDESEVEEQPSGRGFVMKINIQKDFQTDEKETKENMKETSTDSSSYSDDCFVAKNHIIQRKHVGQNLPLIDEGDTGQDDKEKYVKRRALVMYKSPLFWWVLILLGLPSLATMFGISHVVGQRTWRNLPKLLQETEDIAMTCEKSSFDLLIQARAQLAAEQLQQIVRDQFLLHRFSEWLLLGTIKRTDSFVSMQQAAEECKSFPKGNCTYLINKNILPCSCEWKGSLGMVCEGIKKSRFAQQRLWGSQKQDYDFDTGDRNTTSYPKVDQNAKNTSWWTNVFELPGADKGYAASGYETAYARLQVLSAVSVVDFPIHNYYRGTRDNYLGTFIVFDADGMMSGTAGCEFGLAELAHFESTEANGAARIRPDICPAGKYGYDARCREWYGKGKASGKTYAIAPYDSINRAIATGITSPLVDATKNLHIGQVLYEFSPRSFFKNFETPNIHDTGFIILISAASNKLGGDGVVAVNFEGGLFGMPTVNDLLFRYSKEGSRNQDFNLDHILKDMKAGRSGNDIVFDLDIESLHDEETYVSYQPVFVKTKNALDSSNFERGVMENQTLMYSLMMGTCVAHLLGTYHNSEAFDAAEEEMNMLKVIFSVLAFAAIILFTIATTMVTVAVTRPAVILCDIVNSINNGGIKHDIPQMKGGSREANQVYSAFSKLYKIVRFSNTAVFSGNFSWALKFLTDALKLFRNMKDKKAIGIVLNNLGNTYFSFYLTKQKGEGCFCVDNKCVKLSAKECYNEAIDMAVADYENIVNDVTSSDERKAYYACQLANRCFNRGAFLLMTASDPCSLESDEALAIQDIELSAKLDTDVRDYWIRTRQIKQNSEIYFERLILRSYGLLSALKDSSEDVPGLIFEADSLLCSMGKDEQAPLFNRVLKVGRLQQLEEIAIRAELKRGRVQEAARIAVRMLIEDEYILESAFAVAAEAILQSIQPNRYNLLPSSIKSIKANCRQMLKSCKSFHELPSLGKTVTFCYGLSMNMNHLRATKIGIFRFLDTVCHDRDKIGFLVFGNVTTTQNFQLTERKNISSGRLFEEPSIAEESSLCENEQNDLLKDLTNACDVARSKDPENDKWIIMVTDCNSWTCRDAIEDKWHELFRQYAVRIIMIGIDLNGNLESNMRSICRARGSALIEAESTASSIAEAFADAESMISGGAKLQVYATEKF